LKKYLFF